CNFSGPGSINNADPILAPLDYYGGPTPTMALLSGSPAIDGGDPITFPTTDQRGHSRPYGLAPDIGAFESSPPYIIRGTISGPTLIPTHETILRIDSSSQPPSYILTSARRYSFAYLQPSSVSVT